MVMKLVLIAVLVGSASAAVAVKGKKGDNPVKKIVELLTDLKDKVESDGKSEQKDYDKYACWCEKTLGEKSVEITDAKKLIEELNSEIAKLKGMIGTHTVEISQLKKDIANNVESTKEAEAVREKENVEYHEDRTQSEQCIGSLEMAIKVLTGAGEGRKDSFLGQQEAQLLSVATGIREVLSIPKVIHSLKRDDLEKVRDFVARPEDFVGERSSSMMSAAQIAANPFGDYAPQSGAIQGVLKGLYDSMTSDLEKANVEESKKQQSYEDLMETKKKELEALEMTLEKQEVDNGEKTVKLADSNTERDDTKAQLDADEKFFTESKKSCKDKAAQWAERSRMRTQELQGLGKAIEILDDPEAQKNFDKSSESFLQLSMSSRPKDDLIRSYKFIKKLARRYKSVDLAQLAATVKMGGHFDTVINQIDGMLELLKREEAKDIYEKQKCEKEARENKNLIEDLEHTIGYQEETKGRQKDSKKELEDHISTLEDEIKASEDAIKELVDLRVEEEAKHSEATRADAEAVETLNNAIKVLSKAYSFVETEKHHQPETSFSSGDGRRKGAGSGLIAILSMVVEDIEKEMKTASDLDKEAQAEFVADKSDLDATLKAQKEAKLQADIELAALKRTIASTKKLIARKEDDKTAANELKEAIEEDCAWVESDFQDRYDKRKKEMADLTEAKGILAGAEPADDE